MSTRKRRKYISSIKRIDGILAWSHTDKEEVLHDYFTSILGTRVLRSKSLDWNRLGLSTVQEIVGLELDRPFSEEKVAYAVSSLPNDKAPRPDGFTNDFLKQCWPIIKHDVLNAFHSIYFHHCGSLEHINGAQAVLIPKSEVALHPQTLGPSASFTRPRSCSPKYCPSD